MQKPKVSINKIEFSGGQAHTFKSDDKVLIVGPNNSGKSELLREIYKTLEWYDQHIRFQDNKVISDLEVQKDGNSEDLLNFLEASANRSGSNINFQTAQIN